MVGKMVNFDVENPSEDALRSIDVHELLPQQEPFVMIGTLVHFDRKLTVTETVVASSVLYAILKSWSCPVSETPLPHVWR